MINYLASFVNTDGVAFPTTKSVNASAPGAGDGTEFVKLMIDDIWGRSQALMDYAGLVPDGVTEEAGTAQIIGALCHGFGIGPGIGVIYDKNDTPAAHGDRVLLKQGQEILIATYAELFAVTYCGDADNATAPAWYATNGAGVRTTPGAGGTHFVLPDCRGLPLVMIGNATINGRVKTGPTKLGELQEDQMQGHYHAVVAPDNFMSVIAGIWHWGDGVGTLNLFILQDQIDVTGPITDGVNGVPRTGTHTRTSGCATRFGITY